MGVQVRNNSLLQINGLTKPILHYNMFPPVAMYIYKLHVLTCTESCAWTTHRVCVIIISTANSKLTVYTAQAQLTKVQIFI